MIKIAEILLGLRNLHPRWLSFHHTQHSLLYVGWMDAHREQMSVENEFNQNNSLWNDQPINEASWKTKSGWIIKEKGNHNVATKNAAGSWSIKPV